MLQFCITQFPALLYLILSSHLYQQPASQWIVSMSGKMKASVVMNIHSIVSWLYNITITNKAGK